MVDELNPKDIEQNPIGNEVYVEVSMPERFDIKMVEASSLNDYELWVFIASLICNFLVGFVVATISNANEQTQALYIFIDIMFAIFFVISIVLVFKRRNKMAIAKKAITLGMKRSEK